MRLDARKMKMGRRVPASEQATPLLTAARAGRLDTVRSLLQEGADPNKADADGWTPLMAAVLADRPPVIAALVAAGAQPDGRNHQHRTALVEAAWLGRSASVCALLEAGADPNLGDPVRDTDCCDCVLALVRAGAKPDCLMERAAARGRLDLLEELAARGAPVTGQALLAATRAGQLEATRWLLERGADLEARNPVGETPLMGAVGSLPLTLLLLGFGADPTARDHDQVGLLHKTVISGTVPVLELLLQRLEPGARELCSAASLPGREAFLARLLARVPVDARWLGRTALMAAAAGGRLEALQLLLLHGAELELRDPEGCTALTLALAAGQPDTARRLLQAGACLEARDDRGRTPLMRARIDLVPLLLEAGADRTARDQEGLSPAAHQAWRCDRPLLRRLLENGPSAAEVLGEICLAALRQSQPPQNMTRLVRWLRAEGAPRDLPPLLWVARALNDPALYRLVPAGRQAELPPGLGHWDVH